LITISEYEVVNPFLWNFIVDLKLVKQAMYILPELRHTPKNDWVFLGKWVYNSYRLSEFIYHYLLSEEEKKRTWPFVIPPCTMVSGIKFECPTKHWSLIMKAPEETRPVWIIMDATFSMRIQLKNCDSFFYYLLVWPYEKGSIAKFYTKLPSKKTQIMAEYILETINTNKILAKQDKFYRQNCEIQNLIAYKKHLKANKTI